MSDIVPAPSDRPAHYRLSTETWAVILKEYREGATAPELVSRWRVSEHSLRARITRHGATKRDWGDAQAITQAAMRTEAAAEARENDPARRAARLFTGLDLDDGDEGDARVLAQMALKASGRAMRARLWSEAKSLVGLAEAYARLEALTDQGGGGRTPQHEAALRVIMERLEGRGGGGWDAADAG